MAFSADAAVRWLADGLLTGSVQGAVVIAIVWLACRVFTRIPAAVQATLWWLAALKLVLALVPLPVISLPVLPASELAAAAGAIPAPTPATSPTASIAVEPFVFGNGLTILIAVWAAGVFAQAIRLLAAYRDLRGIVERSAPLTDHDAALVSPFALAIGLTRLPAVRVSDEIVAPMVAGLRRPVVLVPAGAHLGSDDLRMALSHELMHIRRLDLALGWVPAIAERLFFFHPLARLAAREYVTAREAACDAAVVAALGVSPDHYGRLLIRLGIARSEPSLTAGGAAASMSSLRRRLDMLKHSTVAGAPRRWTWSLVAFVILALAPFHLAAKTPLRHAPSQSPLKEAAQSVPAEPASQTASAPREQATSRPQTLALENPRAVIESTTPDDALARETRELIRQAMEVRRDRQAQPETVTTQEFLRAQIAELSAQLERMARSTRQDSEKSIEETYRQHLLNAEQAFEAQRQVEATVRNQITTQLDMLRQQQQELTKQMELIAEQQKALAEMQRRMAEETERLREALKSR